MTFRLTEGMLLLGLLSGSGWLLTQAYPDTLSTATAGCIHLLIAGLTALAVCAARRKQWQMSRRGVIEAIALAGAGVFAVPVVTLQLVQGEVPAYTSAAFFCTLPLIVIVVSSYASGRAEWELPDARHLMMPSLIGLGGALLLFPIELPGTLRKAAFLALLAAGCIVLGIASVFLHRLLRGVMVAQAVAITALASAVALGGFAARFDGIAILSVEAVAGEALRALMIDVPVVWLTMWLLRELTPAKASARYLLATFVTLAEGDLLLHIRPSIQDAAGLVLMCVGALLLLYGRDADEMPTLSLR